MHLLMFAVCVCFWSQPNGRAFEAVFERMSGVATHGYRRPDFGVSGNIRVDLLMNDPLT